MSAGSESERPALCTKCGQWTLVKVKKNYRRPRAWSCSNLACAEHQRGRRFIGKVEVV